MAITVPLLRMGKPYESLATADVIGARDGEPLAMVSQANPGLIRRDLGQLQRSVLQAFSMADIFDICRQAAVHFREDNLPVGNESQGQSPRQYIEMLSATSGLPHTLCHSNVDKICYVLSNMARIVDGLTRGVDHRAIEVGMGAKGDIPLGYLPTTDALGVVLPSNSPGVNSIWLPAIALKIPVLIKPGRDEPWTPLRIIRALIAAGYPPQALGYYPTDHEGADVIATMCGRSIIFGDDLTMARYAGNPDIQVHGAGYSKCILGPDVIDHWDEFLDVLESSITDNGGRSCINASCIVVPRHADKIADGLARRLARIQPRSAEDSRAQLAAFTNANVADAIDRSIDQCLETSGAADTTALARRSPRKVCYDNLNYLQPTIIRCYSLDHPLANTEYMFPFASVVEMPIEKIPQWIGPTLVATVVTNDKPVANRFLHCPHIDRLNIGAIPTSHVDWNQPHEGNLFDFLYRRRAIRHQMVSIST